VRSGVRSVAYGRGQSGVLELRFIAANADIKKGDVLVTSGIDGVYPGGLAVATVLSVEHKSSDAFARIICQPTAGIDRHRQFLILLNEQKTVPRPTPPEEIKKEKAPKKRLKEAGKDAAVATPPATTAAPAVKAAKAESPATAPAAGAPAVKAAKAESPATAPAAGAPAAKAAKATPPATAPAAAAPATKAAKAAPPATAPAAAAPAVKAAKAAPPATAPAATAPAAKAAKAAPPATAPAAAAPAAEAAKAAPPATAPAAAAPAATEAGTPAHLAEARK